MLVNKTIHGGLKVLGDIISDGVYTISGYNGVFSNTLYVGAKITGIANLEIGTTAWIKGDTTIGEVAIDTATLTVYGLINVPAGPGYTYGLTVGKHGTIGGNLDIGGKASVGDTIHADFTFYVDENAVNGKLGLFKTAFSGEAVVDIDCRINYDSQLRFLYSGAVQWLIGNDGSTNDFVVTATAGAFSTATDKLRLTGSTHYLYGDGSTALYLNTRGATSDMQLAFRQVSTTKYVLGFDHSADSFKIVKGTSFSTTSAIEVATDNTIKIPSLLGTGIRPVLASATGVLTPATGNYVRHVATLTANDDITVTPSLPTDIIFVDMTVTIASEVIYDYRIDLDAVESDYSRIVVCNVAMDAFAASDCNLRLWIRDSGNVTIWNRQVTDGDAAEEWELELLWDGNLSAWSVFRSTQTV